MFRLLFKSSTLLMPVWLLQACSLTPGMEMQTNSPLSHIEVPVMKDGKLVKEKAQISQITA
ncbi:MAG: polysaccharide biosynthesis/export family protein, partial [Methylobacter sp.]